MKIKKQKRKTYTGVLVFFINYIDQNVMFKRFSNTLKANIFAKKVQSKGWEEYRTIKKSLTNQEFNDWYNDAQMQSMGY